MFNKTSINPYSDYPKSQFSYNTTIIPNGIVWYYYNEDNNYLHTTVGLVS